MLGVELVSQDSFAITITSNFLSERGVTPLTELPEAPTHQADPTRFVGDNIYSNQTNVSK